MIIVISLWGVAPSPVPPLGGSPNPPPQAPRPHYAGGAVGGGYPPFRFPPPVPPCGGKPRPVPASTAPPLLRGRNWRALPPRFAGKFPRTPKPRHSRRNKLRLELRGVSG